MFLNRYEASEKEIKVCDLPRMQQELCQFCGATVPPGGEQTPLWDCKSSIVALNLGGQVAR